MKFRQLEYMIMAAEMGSFNKASEYLYTTQSNVSKVISSLEKELGYDIFRRKGSGVALTDAGKILYEQSRQIMELLEKCASASSATHKTCFHIASVVSNFVAMVYAEFIARHDCKDICLRMWEGSIQRIIELVEDGEAELGLVYMGTRQNDPFQIQLAKKNLYFKEVLPATLVVTVGPKNPYYERESITIAELKNLSYVVNWEDYRAKSYHLKKMEKEFGLEEKLSNAIGVSSDYALINILQRSECAYLCYGGLSFEEKRGIAGVKTLKIENITEDVSLGYISRKSQELSTYAQQFLQLLLELN